MAITVGIFGDSGQGKTTSLVTNPDGTVSLKDLIEGTKETYQGMDPSSTVIINADRKNLPFPKPEINGWMRDKNVFWESDMSKIKSICTHANKYENIKSIFVDTINGVMLDREMNDIKKKSYDKWADLAQEVYEFINFANTELRPDMVVYLVGHVSTYTDTDNNESKCLVTNGRKLEKIRLETKLPIVLFASVNRGEAGKHEYKFETQSNRSTGKSPLGMFKDFLIPNSLKLVDSTIREYYGI